MQNLIKKYKSVILYAVFGVGTTVVNILVYALFSHVMHIGVLISSVIAWFAAVLFAYLTNRKWVFNSRTENARETLREVVCFYIMRLATGIVDWLGMYILADLMNFNDIIIKILMNIIVIILNYIASKLIVFKKG